jgi:hypothetical protein
MNNAMVQQGEASTNDTQQASGAYSPKTLNAPRGEAEQSGPCTGCTQIKHTGQAYRKQKVIPKGRTLTDKVIHVHTFNVEQCTPYTTMP